jgi:histidine triad (HIT) family protein
MSSDCVFCRIVAGTEPARVLHRDDDIVAFHDINPQAPVHVLVVPTEHIATVNDIRERHATMLGRLHLVAGDLARRQGVAAGGYRTLFNCGGDAGQSVWHIHLHLLGGRRMGWPPWPHSS